AANFNVECVMWKFSGPSAVGCSVWLDPLISKWTRRTNHPFIELPFASNALHPVVHANLAIIRRVIKIDVVAVGDFNRVYLPIRGVRWVANQRDRCVEIGGRDIVNATIERNTFERLRGA